jgi:isocitrate dehydrogenase
MAKIKVKTRRGTGRRRDDPHHLRFIKDKLIPPHRDTGLKYYDLGVEYRGKTDDQMTVDAGTQHARADVSQPWPRPDADVEP